MITALSWAVLVLFVLSTAHMFYEGVIAPTLRLRSRYKIFALRDELRALCLETESEALAVLQHQMNSAVQAMPFYRMSMAMHVARELAQHPELEVEINRKIEIVNSCNDARVQSLSKRLRRVMRGVFIINAGGWFIYLIPAAVCALAYDWLRNVTIRMLNLPEQCLRKMLEALGDVRYAHANG